jgi:hypothetical protein
MTKRADPDPLLTGPEAAKRCNISANTWRGYVHRGYVPPADDPDEGRPVNRRSPRWYQSTVDHFRTHRRGHGARTDLKENKNA